MKTVITEMNKIEVIVAGIMAAFYPFGVSEIKTWATIFV